MLDIDPVENSYVFSVRQRPSESSLDNELELVRLHLQQAVAVTGFCTVHIDYRSNRSYLSPEAASLFGIAFDKLREQDPADKAADLFVALSASRQRARTVDRKTIHQRFHPEDSGELNERIARCLDPLGDGWFEMEHRVVHPDGSVHWLNVRKQVFFEGSDETRRPHHAILVAAEITARKAAEAAERIADIRLALALEASGGGVFEIDCVSGAKLYTRRTFALLDTPQPPDIKAVSPTDEIVFARMLQRAFWKKIHPDDRDTVKLALERAYNSESGASGRYEAEYRVMLDGGGIRWIGARGDVTFDHTGRNPVRLVGILHDITLTKDALEAQARLHERERNIAKQLQEALVPAIPASIRGLSLASYYRPALEESEVGGDFFDAFSIRIGSADAAVLVVADVSGKGLAAAQQVSTVRNMLRYALYNGANLAESITALNITLSDNNLLDGFTTLFLAVYVEATGALTYVNCGQEPGLLWRYATRQVEPLEPTGPVLGGFREAVFKVGSTVLAPGDSLMLITDGLTEAGPNRSTMLGIDGVSHIFQCSCETAEKGCNAENMSVAPVQGVVDSVIAAVQAFAGDGVRDDIAFLLAVASS